jgi:GH25 family lysozyme M1 (1,4-beta-N-acetylmuramidase)
MFDLHPKYDICGIDLSHHQYWSNPTQTVNKGVKFVAIRAGYGIKPDRMLKSHRAAAQRVNLPTAFYWYWLPHYGAREQVQKIRLSVGGGERLFIDLEKNNVDRWEEGITPEIITEKVLEFINECDRAFGDEVGIYTSQGWWGRWIQSAYVGLFRMPFRPKWVAQWFYSYQPRPYPLPYGWSDFDLWQFSGTTGPLARKASEFGVTRSVSLDFNAFNGNERELDRLFKYTRRKFSGGSGNMSNRAM